MVEIVNIVTGLQKDVKRINKCLTKEGAIDYIKGKSGWNAFEQDITGPNGELDGIPEVIFTDSQGNIKGINGYGLFKGTYHRRKPHQAMKRVAHMPDGKSYTYKAFNQDLYKIHEGFNNEGNPYYENELLDDFPTYYVIIYLDHQLHLLKNYSHSISLILFMKIISNHLKMQLNKSVNVQE